MHKSNWSRFGPDDEIGMLNLQDEAKVRQALSLVRNGTVISLGQAIGQAKGVDPVWPGRLPAQRYMVKNWADYHVGKVAAPAGGVSFSSDDLHLSLHGTTHVDALGHVFADNTLYNGYPAHSTVGGLARNGVEKLAAKGLVLPAVLVDLPKTLGPTCAEADFHVTCGMLKETLAAEDAELQSGMALLVRTGWIEQRFKGRTTLGQDPNYREPGLTDDQDTLDFFADHDVVLYGTDTLGNEQTISAQSGDFQPLHRILIQQLGIIFVEIMDLESLAAACAERGQYTFCLMLSPLKITGATASPVNPLALL